MASYRILKSVAHNWAHSFLTGINIVDDTIVTQHLLEAARAMNEPHLEIDVLNATIKPERARTPSIAKALKYGAAAFARILESQRCTSNMVRAVYLTTEFNFNELFPAFKAVKPFSWYAEYLRTPECPVYTASVSLVDDRGKTHTAELREW